ncbi:hypothetical protein B0H14DRAFT_2566369 [Mycena olivaceomarginata]|nr:hypothetical protein B0H14DRAFT_2566369 [Mycena olivaceomarginata]
MSGFHHYPRGYSTDENDASPEEFFPDPGQNFSSFMPYPEALWQAPAPGGEYNISIDTSAVGPNSGLVNPNYTPVQSSYPTTSQQQQQWPRRTSEGVTSLSQHWPVDIPRRSSEGSAASSLDHVSGPAYVLPEYAEPGPFAFGPYQGYLHGQHISPTEHISPVNSTEDLLSPRSSQLHRIAESRFVALAVAALRAAAAADQGKASSQPSPFGIDAPLLPQSEERTQPLYTHRDQLQFFKDALSLPSAGVSGPFVPQLMYKPHTNSDRRRYVEEVDMEAPIHFWVENPSECGIPLSDALHSRVRRLLKRDETVFEGRGPSVSIRLEWPGYRQWSRQIPTKDFRSPPGPITRAKLAKNVAKCVQRFIQERHGQPMEDDADARWRVGPGPNQIKLEDLILVSIHHVSMGSWQPHLRLRRPF